MSDQPVASVAILAAKTAADAASYSIVFATVLNLLPPLAALISILWIGFQFYHTEQMKVWRQRRKEKHGNL